MSKILPATCEGEVVKVGMAEVMPVVILSAGKGESAGIVVMEGPIATYVTSNATDLAETLETVSSALSSIGGGLGLLAASDGNPILIAAIGVISGQLSAAAASLSALKENLK